MLTRSCIGILFVGVFVGPSTCAASGILEIHVRDVQTNYSVRARVTLQGPRTVSVETDNFGSVRLSLPAGEYQEEVSAPGYQTMRSHIPIQTGKTSPMGFMLDPVTPPREDLAMASKFKPGFTLLHGYAVDERGRPVAGVRVYLQKANVEAKTNE